MRWVVIGAGGCFGQDLVRHLLSINEEVIGIGRNPRKPRLFSLGIDYPYYSYHTTYEHEYIAALVNGYRADVIVNFAAQGEGAASFNEDAWRFYETNSMGLARLVSEMEFGRFVQIGTSELYGSVTKPSKEDDPIIPSSPYAASKAAFDLHLISMHKAKGLSMNIVRPSNCYCPGQQLHRIIPKALLYGVTGKAVQLHGGGRSKKSYLEAEDLSRAIVLVAKGPDGEVYNVGPDSPTSIKDVVDECARALGKDIKVEIASERTGQDGCYWLDSSKVQDLGWKQTVGWEVGMAKMVNWVRAYPELQHLPTDFVMRA